MEHNVVYIGNDRCRLYVGSSRRCVVTEPLVPYDAEIEYLESTGTDAYIDTGITPTLSYSVEMEFKWVSPWSTSDASGTLFGTMNGWNKNTFMVVMSYTSSSKRIYNCWGNNSVNNNNSSYIIGLADSWHSLTFRGRRTYIDGTDIAGATSTSGNPIGSVYVFCANYSNTNTYGRGTIKQIRSFKLYDASSNLVMDLIPVRKGTTGYMYDKISKKLFGNAGTDAFVLGPDKSTLPYDAEVEYLESTGTQCVDSGIECTSDLKVEFNGMFTTTVNAGACGGIANLNPYFRHHWSPSDNNFYWIQYNNNSSSSIQMSSSANTWYIVTVDPVNGTASVNGTSKTFTAITSVVSTGQNYFIFARKSGDGGTQSRPCRFKSFKMWRNNILLRDFIAVRKGTIGYLYDKVSGSLFGNAGTDSFILGNDKT